MNLRKDKRKANLAKWRNQGPAIIERPLQLIATLLDTRKPTGERIMNPITKAAYFSANRGDGARVRMVARQVLRST